jgi:hypothetical protein
MARPKLDTEAVIMKNGWAFGLFALAGAATLALLLAACGDAGQGANGGDSDDAQASLTGYPCESVAPPSISSDEAVAVAREDAAHIIKDGEVRSTAVELMSIQQAQQVVSGADVVGQPQSCIWLVTMDGFFYEPQGPVVPDRTPMPEGTVCGRIRVIIIPDTGHYDTLQFERIDDCS